MSLAPITLTTDKSKTVIDNAHRRLRQSERGLSLTVTVLNEGNTAYDLTGKNLVFCENKQNNKIIIDDGKGDNSGKFNRNSDNDTKGVFTYVLQEDAYEISGKAWFEITDGTTVDSTRNFYFDVEIDASISFSSNDYIGPLYAHEDEVKALKNALNWKTVDGVNADNITYTSKLFLTNASGAPDNDWGYLITSRGYDAPIRVTQEWWSDSGNTGLAAQHYYRQITYNNNQNWSPWLAQATQNDIDSLNSRIKALENANQTKQLVEVKLL